MKGAPNMAWLQKELRLGTWQGIYLCEHRDQSGPRRLVLTVHGE
jgi:thiamine phosphate synthase YjbQ (UPF0047 family)